MGVSERCFKNTRATASWLTWRDTCPKNLTVYEVALASSSRPVTRAGEFNALLKGIRRL